MTLPAKTTIGAGWSAQLSYEAGFRWVIVGPKRNPLSVCRTEKSASDGLHGLRRMGCRAVPIEEFMGLRDEIH